MRTQHGLNTKRNNIMKKLFLVAKAEEGNVADTNTTATTGETTPTNNVPTINIEDLMAKARSEEKAKLYPKIEKLEKENKALVEKNNTHLLSLGEKDALITSLNKEIEQLKATSNKTVSDKEKELLSQIEQLKAENEDLKNNTVSREEIENEIKAVYDVKLYREQKLRELGDTVIPDLVLGTTKEEIDNSIELSQNRLKEIQEKIMNSYELPVVNTNVASFQKANVSVEDIVNLNPSSPEYAQLRAKLGIR